MDEEIERLVISVRADTQGFARDVSEMRGSLEGPLGVGADRAGRAIETGLLRAVRTGKLGFEDLRDCVGLAGLALRAAGCGGDIPGGYALRGGGASAMLALIDREMLARVDRPEPGDLMLFAVGPGQFHLAIRTVRGMVHADAMLRRVVERPGEPPWRLIAAWTLAEQDGGTG